MTDRACKLTITGGMNRPPMERSRGTVELFRQAQGLARAMGFALEEASTGGGSDGNFTAALGIPTLDGMGAVGEGAHATHESIVVDELAKRTALLAAMIAGMNSSSRISRFAVVQESDLSELLVADGVEMLLDGEGIEGGERKGSSKEMRLIQRGEGLRVGAVDFLRRAEDGGGVGHAPMRGDGLTGPDGTDFFRCVIADGKYEVEMRRAGLGKLVPGFAAQAFGAEPADSICRSASGRTVPDGWLPAL